MICVCRCNYEEDDKNEKILDLSGDYGHIRTSAIIYNFHATFAATTTSIICCYHHVNRSQDKLYIEAVFNTEIANREAAKQQTSAREHVTTKKEELANKEQRFFDPYPDVLSIPSQ